MRKKRGAREQRENGGEGVRGERRTRGMREKRGVGAGREGTGRGERGGGGKIRPRQHRLTSAPEGQSVAASPRVFCLGEAAGDGTERGRRV